MRRNKKPITKQFRATFNIMSHSIAVVGLQPVQTFLTDMLGLCRVLSFLSQGPRSKKPAPQFLLFMEKVTSSLSSGQSPLCDCQISPPIASGTSRRLWLHRCLAFVHGHSSAKFGLTEKSGCRLGLSGQCRKRSETIERRGHEIARNEEGGAYKLRLSDRISFGGGAIFNRSSG